MRDAVGTLGRDVVDDIDVRQLHPDPGDAELGIDRHAVVLEIQHHQQGVVGQGIWTRLPADHLLSAAAIAAEPRRNYKAELPVFSRVAAGELQARVAPAQSY